MDTDSSMPKDEQFKHPYFNQFDPEEENDEREGAVSEQNNTASRLQEDSDGDYNVSQSHHYERVDDILWPPQAPGSHFITGVGDGCHPGQGNLRDVYARLERVERNQQQMQQAVNALVTEMQHVKTTYQSLHQLVRQYLERLPVRQRWGVVLETPNDEGQQTPDDVGSNCETDPHPGRRHKKRHRRGRGLPAL